MPKTVLYEKRDKIAIVTINRPEAMNAIDLETHWELIDVWTSIRDDPAVWVAILTGAGEKSFSAGADLKKLIPQVVGRDVSVAEAREQATKEFGLGGITRGLQIWKPLIAAINGFCLAGGLELALACDLRVAAEHATFGQTEVRWAIIPGAGGTQRLPRAVPLAKAMEMILMGEMISAQEAHRVGLVNRVVPAAEVMPTALKWAETIMERGPLAVRAAKEAVVRGLGMNLEDGLRLEQMLSLTLRGTQDAVEGPKAFAEKRKPVFKGH